LLTVVCGGPSIILVATIAIIPELRDGGTSFTVEPLSSASLFLLSFGLIHGAKPTAIYI